MKLLRRAASVATMCGMSVALAVGSVAPASAAYAPAPIGPTEWIPDGPVLAVVVSGNRVFVGGTFTGGFAALDATTGALVWTGKADGGVRALAMSADGTHVIAGGGFLTVDGATHRKLASINAATGVAEPKWRASAGGMVRDIQVVGDTAYFGGTFAKHNGLVQRGLGAVSVTTGKPVVGFTAATDGDVYALATDGTRLAVGGKFTAIDGQARNALGSVTLAGGSLDPWRPAPPCSTCLKYWDLALDSNTVYGVGRNNGAAVAIDFSTGATRWATYANGDGQAVAVADGRVYVGGHFTSIGSPRVPRFILAALDARTGAVDPSFTPTFVTSYPGIWALAASPTRLYAGGYFTAAGPTPPKRYPYFAMYSSS
jgi:outer membrane protein assembly factor BamB